uniref:Cytochrome c-553 n=1 Tax=Neotessella volvocina TaxID=52559 RepID=A0A3G2R0Z6_9STRA|nr:cytochrome c6 [Neotessella volvocina]AYO28771.1 cytochrome c6 [Neotessella volvocina]
MILTFVTFLNVTNVNSIAAKDLEIGKQLFAIHCTACHIGGTNVILPEKNLQQEVLENNGMNTVSAITYQILNGKNGMPAFGGRLTEDEIEEIAKYVLIATKKNFKENKN